MFSFDWKKILLLFFGVFLGWHSVGFADVAPPVEYLVGGTIIAIVVLVGVSGGIGWVVWRFFVSKKK